jgi:L1 cell adhesion molecule like protein
MLTHWYFPASRRLAQIEATFDIDANKILNVSAFDESIGKEREITITNGNCRLSEDEIQQMIDDIHIYNHEDQLEHDCIQAKNTLEFLFQYKNKN